MSNSKTNYFKLGLFVFFIIIALVATVVVVGVGAFDQKPFYVETYFSNSVQGLNVGSDVLFLGVPIGTVEQLSFVEEQYDTYKDYIYVKMSIKKEFLICKKDCKDRTVEIMKKEIEDRVARGLNFKLVSQGITGLVAIEASYASKTNKVKSLEIDWKPANAYIPSVPSIMTQVTDSIEKLVDLISSDAIQHLGSDLLLTASNVQYIISEQLTPAIQNIEVLTAVSTDVMSNVNDVVIHEMRNNIKPILINVQKTTDELPELVGKTQSTIDNVDAMIDKADVMLSSKEGTINDILRNVADITSNVRKISENASTYSSGMLFSEPPPDTSKMLDSIFKKEKKETEK